MRMLVVAACIMVVAASPAAARLVSAGYGKSWGKAGVSLEQYRADSVACGRLAAGTDLRGTDPAEALVIATRLIDNGDEGSQAAAKIANSQAGGAPVSVIDLAGPSLLVDQMVNPGRQISKAADILHSTLDQCLTERGYRRFHLTSDQMRRLSKLPLGSDARRSYLHSLASNPQILARQTIEENE
jgi:hypothetical protein